MQLQAYGKATGPTYTVESQVDQSVVEVDFDDPGAPNTSWPHMKLKRQGRSPRKGATPALTERYNGLEKEKGSSVEKWKSGFPMPGKSRAHSRPDLKQCLH